MKLVFLLLLLSVVSEAKRYNCNENLSCGCGYSNVEMHARIINGEIAIPYSWSMVVSLRYDFYNDGNTLRHACGGTILTDSYILTSANCVENIDDVKLVNLTIAAGNHIRSAPHQTVRTVDEIIIHPNWTGSWNDHQNDIALLHLSAPLGLEYNTFITRTCLPLQLNTAEKLIQYPPIGIELGVVGWGRTDILDDDSDVLQQKVVYAIDYNDRKCTDIVSDAEKQFCARTYDSNAGPCYGDFGGPIFQWIEDHWEQVGIISFTPDGCKQNSAIGYTRLAYYRDWIEEYIKNTGETPATTTLNPIIITESPTITYRCNIVTAPCGCSRRNVQFSQSDNITNHEAIPYSWSMIVSIRLNGLNNHSCSGSILSDFYILTSASCIANSASFGITIVAGIHNYTEDEGIERQVDRIYFHPEYKGISDNYANNIAILHISQTLNIEHDVFISRICLPEIDEDLPHPIYYPSPGTRLAVTGWGSMNCLNKTDQHLLQQLQLRAVNDFQKNCYILDEHRAIQFCAEVENQVTDTVPCVGDPGSPIFQWFIDHWQQVGITSHIIDFAQFRNLGIYTRLVEYNDWIQSIISDCSTISPTPPTTVSTASTTTTTGKPPITYQCDKTSTCGCGPTPVVLTPLRIVGGENAAEFSWPMIASLRWMNEDAHICGGSIISNSYILTAAHCIRFIPDSPIDVTIAVGMTNLSDPKQIRRTVDRAYIHPSYIGRNDNYRHDIALLHINQSLTFEVHPSIAKTCIHRLSPSILNNQYIKNGTRLTVIGWGDTLKVSEPQILQQVEVYAIDNEDQICKNSMNDSQTQFCAGLPEGGKDSCQGDSGGPIFQYTGQYWEQLGIVSYGNGCAEPGNPGVYTRLSYYYDWINNILKNDNEHLEPEFSSNQTTVNPGTTTTSQTGSITTNISQMGNTTTTTSQTGNITTNISQTGNTTTTTLQTASITTSTSATGNITTTTLQTGSISTSTSATGSITTTTNETTPTTRNNAYNHQDNTFIYAIFVLLVSVILL